MSSGNSGQFVSGDPRARQWKPGETGNAGGRPKGLGPLIRHETRGGEELVDFVLLVFRKGALKHRLWAVEWLADRGYGRPIQETHIKTKKDFLTLVTIFGKKIKDVLGEESYAQVAAALTNLSLEELQQFADEEP